MVLSPLSSSSAEAALADPAAGGPTKSSRGVALGVPVLGAGFLPEAGGGHWAVLAGSGFVCAGGAFCVGWSAASQMAEDALLRGQPHFMNFYEPSDSYFLLTSITKIFMFVLPN